MPTYQTVYDCYIHTEDDTGQVTRCFTPSHPVRLYQDEENRREKKLKTKTTTKQYNNTLLILKTLKRTQEFHSVLIEMVACVCRRYPTALLLPVLLNVLGCRLTY